MLAGRPPPRSEPTGRTSRMTDHETNAPHGGTLVELLGPTHGPPLVDLLVPDQHRENVTDEATNFPKLAVKERELSDLEMLAIGALSPLTGFQGEAEYHSIRASMHLTHGLPR